MHRRCSVLLGSCLAAFACLVVLWQVVNRDGGKYWPSSIIPCYVQGNRLSEISDIPERDTAFYPPAKHMRYLDMLLPKEARIFVQGMVTVTNFVPTVLPFAFSTYYLFPREIGVSLDRPAQLTLKGFLGKPAASDEEILRNGFDVRIYMTSTSPIDVKTRPDLALRPPDIPKWFSGHESGDR